MQRLVSSLVVVLLVLQVQAQELDTAMISESSFLKQVLSYDPSVLNSSLSVQMQNQEYLEARGAFEPKLKGSYNRKKFEGKEYYGRFNSGMTVNTPIGIKVQGGFEQNGGIYLNPESNVPINGLAYAGVEIPIGAGLFTDEERAEVKKNVLENEAASYLNTLTVNERLLEAGETYWDWYGSIMILQITDDALLSASKRLDFVKQKNVLGYAADIDTLEALINYQNRNAMKLSALVKWEKNRNQLKNYLWSPDLEAKQMVALVDQNYTSEFMDSSIYKNWVDEHPMIKLLEMDSLVNRVEISLAREYFKPQLDLSMKLLETPDNFGNFDFEPANNQYVGLNFYMPMFLRKQRAKAQKMLYKEEVISNKKSQTKVKIESYMAAYYANTQDLKRSVELWRSAVVNYKKMLKAEQVKFELGESSLFVVNNRELKWIDAREKYAKSYTEYRKSILRYYYTLGVLADAIQ